jgi:hypothetical protein
VNTFQWIAASIIGVLSVARTARLIVWDEYPPTIWLRMKWDDATGESGWNKLLHCQFCLTPWLAAGMLLWAWLAGIEDDSASSVIWWVVNGWWAGSYLAASYVAYDQPEE